MELEISFKISGSEDELRSSTPLMALVEGLSAWALRSTDSESDSDSGFDPDADDAAAELADAEAASTPAPSGPGTVPGVPVDGQAGVQDQLAENPAADLFKRYMAETSSWDSAKVVGIKPRRSPAGAPLDYSRYLRLRKEGSQLGAFAYVNPSSCLIEPRLHYASDAELHKVAPRAERHTKGHPEYRVNIWITDEKSLEQAVKLSRLAYDRT